MKNPTQFGKYSLSLIIPALNEEQKVEECITDAHRHLKESFADFEIILINDGSTDSTPEIMNRLSKELDHIVVIHNSVNLGLGSSWKKAADLATKDYVANISGDGGMLACNWPRFLKDVGRFDIITTYVENLREIKPFLRFLISKGYVYLLNIITFTKLKYYNGPTIYKKSDIKGIDVISTGMGFQSEVLVTLLKSNKNLSLRQIPILCQGEKNSNALKLRNIMSIFPTLRKILQSTLSMNVAQALPTNEKGK